MIMTVARNIVGIFEDKNRRVVDLLDNRLTDLLIDNRRMVSEAVVELNKANGATEQRTDVIDVMLRHEKAQANLDMIEMLSRDLDSIKRQVFLGA